MTHTWRCSCGAYVDGNFCHQCGAKCPQEPYDSTRYVEYSIRTFLMSTPLRALTVSCTINVCISILGAIFSLPSGLALIPSIIFTIIICMTLSEIKNFSAIAHINQIAANLRKLRENLYNLLVAQYVGLGISFLISVIGAAIRSDYYSSSSEFIVLFFALIFYGIGMVIYHFHNYYLRKLVENIEYRIYNPMATTYSSSKALSVCSWIFVGLIGFVVFLLLILGIVGIAASTSLSYLSDSLGAASGLATFFIVIIALALIAPAIITHISIATLASNYDQLEFTFASRAMSGTTPYYAPQTLRYSNNLRR